MIEINLSGTSFIFDNNIENNSRLNSNFASFKLPLTHCRVENIDFQPEIRIYDKYLYSDSINYDQIFDTLNSYLQNKFEMLSSLKCPFDYGQLFAFVVQKENRYLYYYHLIQVDKVYYLLETISTYGTKKELDKNLKILVRNIKKIKN